VLKREFERNTEEVKERLRTLRDEELHTSHTLQEKLLKKDEIRRVMWKVKNVYQMLVENMKVR
jgi:hypothetical protein